MNTIKLNTIGTPCKAGGSGGGTASGGNKGYYNIADLDVTTKRFMMSWSSIINGETTMGAKVIEPSGAFCMRTTNSHEYAKKVCIDFDAPVWLDSQQIKVADDIQRKVGSLEQLNQFCPPITESEFYTL